MRIRASRRTPFIKCIEHPDFVKGVTTSFIGDNPSLLSIGKSAWDVMHFQSSQDKVFRVERNLRYLANVAVNGHPRHSARTRPKLDKVRTTYIPKPDVARRAGALAQDFEEEGPEALPGGASKPSLLVTDTTQGTPPILTGN